MDELKPCPNPWCDGKPAYLYGRLRDDGMRYVCAKCHIGPPLAKTEAEAIAAWNTRPAPSPADAGLVAGFERAVLRYTRCTSPEAQAAADELCDEWRTKLIEALSGEYARALEDAAQTLEVEASILRTPAGRLQAQWHENDAEMVARELCRRAAAIRTLKAGALNEENENA